MVPGSDASMASASVSLEKRTVDGREVVEEKAEAKEASSAGGGGKREREEEIVVEGEGGKEKLKSDKVGGVVEGVKGPEHVKEL